MEVSGQVIADAEDCVEILVRTEKSKFNVMPAPLSSFETLLRTALALEENPSDEHSYAFNNKKIENDTNKKMLFKDHCYSIKTAHRKVQSLSDEDLHKSSDSALANETYKIPPHYLSKDSALDVTGFDSISEKCHSFENIHLKTVDVMTDKCIMPGISDPDISRMTIQVDRCDLTKSASLPNSPPKEEANFDHTYATNLALTSGYVDADHSYIKNEKDSTNSFEKRNFIIEKDDATNFSNLDHTYQSVGRVRNTMINYFERKFDGKNCDVTESPFIDHTYQSIPERKMFKYRKPMSEKSVTDVTVPSKRKINDLSEHSRPQPLLLIKNRNYPEIPTIIIKPSSSSDHSYVAVGQENKKCEDEDHENMLLSGFSDSGTESLNDDEEETMDPDQC